MKPLKLLICLCFVLPPAAEALPDERAALEWTTHRELRDVRSIFCHPTDPLVAWAATSSGLLKTVDEGRNWQAVAEASREKVGLVTNLICCAADENRLLMGTDAKGLFLSADGGKTFKSLGGEGDKPASGHVEYVSFGDSDPSWRTIFVTHGRAATGMSISRDLGATWEVFARDRYLKSFVKDGDTIVAAGSMLETDGEVWGIHRSGWDGQRWEECNRGQRPGQAALPILHPLRFMFSTLDGGVLESNDDGRTWYSVARIESASWESLFFTHGRTGSAEILVGYDPYRQGVVLSDRRFRPGSRGARNRGLYVGPFVKSGASCRANANGTSFYVVLNDSLWIGRRVPAKSGPTVVQARCLPATAWVQTYVTSGAERAFHQRIEAAAGTPREADVKGIAEAYSSFSALKKSMGFTVQARVGHPKGSKAIKAVTVDLSILGRSRTTELYDDGRHGDEKPGDGLWGVKVPFLPGDFEKLPRADRRQALPGMSAVTVTAFDTGGASDNWSAVISIFRRPEPVSLWPGGRHLRFSSTDSEGPLRVYEARGEGPSGQGDAVCFDASGPGPWRGAWIMGAGGLNISGRDAVSFHVKGDVPQELYVHVVDRYVVGSDAIDVPHYSRPVPLIGGGYLKAITPAYQKVRVSMKKLLPKGTLFLRRHGAGFALSVGEGGKPGRYYIADFRAVP